MREWLTGMAATLRRQTGHGAWASNLLSRVARVPIFRARARHSARRSWRAPRHAAMGAKAKAKAKNARRRSRAGEAGKGARGAAEECGQAGAGAGARGRRERWGPAAARTRAPPAGAGHARSRRGARLC